MAESTAKPTDTIGAQMKISAVCVSRGKEAWGLQGTPFYNYTEGWKPFQHEQTRERIAYLANRRNVAVAKALSLFPRTEHILMIDSYYVHQEDQIDALITEYTRMTMSEYPDGCILGASAWILDRTRMRSRLRFYDGWTTPEAMGLKLQQVERSGGIMKVSAVGGCYLYPRWLWEKIRYGVPEDLHGCEHNWLCERSGLQVFLSLNERLWREPVVYPRLKRMRVSLHLGRLIGR